MELNTYNPTHILYKFYIGKIVFISNMLNFYYISLYYTIHMVIP
jgi:hypothetical protein